MTLDELLLEWSYKSEKGYPSLDNPSDISILKQILEDLKLPTDQIIQSLKEQEDLKDEEDIVDDLEDQPTEEEPETEETPEEESEEEDSVQGSNNEYDNLIRTTLGVENIPTSKNKYKYPGPGGGTYEERVKEEDLDTYQKLWEAAPEKKTEKGVATAGVGKGEVSLYWLYNYSNSDVKVEEGRAGDDPDLFFNGNGVEVKAYGSHNSLLSIGRYGTDKENLRLLGTIFGIATLARVFGGEGTDKTINPTNFKGTDLKNAFEHVVAFSDINMEELAEIYPVFSDIKANIDYVDSLIEFSSAEEGALAMGRKFLKDKMARKPGDGNFLVNLKKDGSMKFFNVSFDTIDSDENILTKMGSSQSAMKLNFTKTFG